MVRCGEVSGEVFGEVCGEVCREVCGEWQGLRTLVDTTRRPHATASRIAMQKAYSTWGRRLGAQGCSVCCLWLQPLLPTVAASAT